MDTAGNAGHSDQHDPNAPAFRHHHGHRLQHGPQTSMWALLATCANTDPSWSKPLDHNIFLSSSLSSDVTIAPGASTCHSRLTLLLQQHSPWTTKWHQVVYQILASAWSSRRSWATDNNTNPGCGRAMDQDISLCCSLGLNITMPPPEASWSSSQPPTWTQVAKQTPGIHVAFSDYWSPRHHHRPWMCYGQRPRHDHWLQPERDVSLALGGKQVPHINVIVTTLFLWFCFFPQHMNHFASHSIPFPYICSLKWPLSNQCCNVVIRLVDVISHPGLWRPSLAYGVFYPPRNRDTRQACGCLQTGLDYEDQAGLWVSVPCLVWVNL